MPFGPRHVLDLAGIPKYLTYNNLHLSNMFLKRAIARAQFNPLLLTTSQNPAARYQFQVTFL